MHRRRTWKSHLRIDRWSHASNFRDHPSTAAFVDDETSQAGRRRPVEPASGHPSRAALVDDEASQKDAGVPVAGLPAASATIHGHVSL